MSMVLTPRASYAQGIAGLPEPGAMVNLSSSYVPLMITGLTMHHENPLLMDFIVSTGNSGLNATQVKEQSNRLIKYFLACLTIPENDQWVNLSPYEKQRIVPQDLGETVLGQDMLAQDYLLKQLTASLIYPEKNLGKDFWDKVYSKAAEMYGTTHIPVNTFNKVWILPDTAKVYEHKDTVLVVKSHLKVMLDEDYLALSKHINVQNTNSLGNQIIRQIILPAIEQEVNTGKNFAQLRQIYNSMILAVWFKKNLKQALLNQVYTDKAKVNGVNADDPAIKEKIYQQYIAAYKKGVFNYIKEEVDQGSHETIPRKYFSGGLTPVTNVTEASVDEAMSALQYIGNLFRISGLAQETTVARAQTAKEMTVFDFMFSEQAGSIPFHAKIDINLLPEVTGKGHVSHAVFSKIEKGRIYYYPKGEDIVKSLDLTWVRSITLYFDNQIEDDAAMTALGLLDFIDHADLRKAGILDWNLVHQFVRIQRAQLNDSLNGLETLFKSVDKIYAPYREVIAQIFVYLPAFYWRSVPLLVSKSNSNGGDLDRNVRRASANALAQIGKSNPERRAEIETALKAVALVDRSKYVNDTLDRWAAEKSFNGFVANTATANAAMTAIGSSPEDIDEMNGQTADAAMATLIQIARGVAYWQGSITTTPITRPFRASRKGDVKDIVNATPEEELRLERKGILSILQGEGDFMELIAGASSRMNVAKAPEEVKSMVDKKIESKAGVPIGIVDGQVITYLDSFGMNIHRLLEQIRQEARKAGVRTDRLDENELIFMTNDAYLKEHETIIAARQNYGLRPEQIRYVQQPLEPIYWATPADVEKLKSKFASEADYQAALAKSKDVESRLAAGQEDAVVSDQRDPLGHGEFFHQLIISGELLRMFDKGKKWFFVKNVDNYAAKFDRLWLQILGRFLEQNLDFQPEVSPRAPAQKGGSLIVMEDTGSHQLAEDPNLNATKGPDGKPKVNPTDSFWFNDAVAIGRPEYVASLYLKPGQDLKGFLAEYRQAVNANNREALETIAERGRGKFPKLLDPKPAKNGPGATVKIETNLWQSTGVVPADMHVQAIGVRGARNFDINDYPAMTPEEKTGELAKLRFLATKQWNISAEDRAKAKKNLAEAMGREVTDAEVDLTLESYEGNKLIADDLLNYILHGDLITPGILSSTGAQSSDAAMVLTEDELTGKINKVILGSQTVGKPMEVTVSKGPFKVSHTVYSLSDLADQNAPAKILSEILSHKLPGEVIEFFVHQGLRNRGNELFINLTSTPVRSYRLFHGITVQATGDNAMQVVLPLPTNADPAQIAQSINQILETFKASFGHSGVDVLAPIFKGGKVFLGFVAASSGWEKMRGSAIPLLIAFVAAGCLYYKYSNTEQENPQTAWINYADSSVESLVKNYDSLALEPDMVEEGMVEFLGRINTPGNFIYPPFFTEILQHDLENVVLYEKFRGSKVTIRAKITAFKILEKQSDLKTYSDLTILENLALSKENFDVPKEFKQWLADEIKSKKTSRFHLSSNVNRNGGIDLNSRYLDMQSEGEKVDIAFNQAMIAQFRRGDFSGIQVRILDVVPVSLLSLIEK